MHERTASNHVRAAGARDGQDLRRPRRGAAVPALESAPRSCHDVQRALRRQGRRYGLPRVEVYRIGIDQATLMLGIVLSVCALLIMWNVGSMCQAAKVEGMSMGSATAQQKAYDHGYEVGYANAKWDADHPDGVTRNA